LKNVKIIIAGPCAVESKYQLFATAKELYQLQTSDFVLHFFRAGVWKARSNHIDFQGIGNEALVWLQEIKKQFGFNICVEVASAAHVQRCVENNIDAIWIGARTTVNPFLVQEIAEATTNSNLTVLVKNPINPDLSLWIGAIQRFQNAGTRKIMAVHRGFSIVGENVYRNTPCWEIPVALHLKYLDIPLLCDISHISGDVSLQPAIAQTATDYGFDGIMAEVHYAPEQALSDSKQQLSPLQFTNLLRSLTFSFSRNDADNALFIQRNLIKNIDIQISKLLRKRMETVDEIASIKVKYSLPLLQTEQWKKVVEIYEENALKDKNYQHFIEEFLLLLHKSSLKRQG
jgi:chorismate mutase